MADELPRKPRYRQYAHLGIETVTYWGPLETMATHAHAQFQLTLYDGGPRRFRVGHRDLAGAPRTSIVIQSGEPHSSVPVADPLLALRTYYIEDALFAEIAASLWNAPRSVVFRDPLIRDATIEAALHDAHRALDGGAPDAEEKTYLALAQLVRRRAEPTRRPRKAGASEARLALVRELLADRAAENIALSELALAAGLSRFHLIRAFRSRYGCTPFAYQRQQRIERARAVLRAGSSIADAAAAAGFADQSHLGRSFRAVMGATPGEYRDSYRTLT